MSAAEVAREEGSTTPPRRSGRARRVFARMALLAGSILLALLAAELCVRAAGIRVPPRGDQSMSLIRSVPEEAVPGLGYELIPGATAVATYPGAGDEPGREVRYAINSLGFRGPETTEAKPPGTVRVIAVGDSFTYGTGVDDADTWPRLLEAELRARAARSGAEQRVEVLNWGVPAYNTRQELAQLKHKVARFAPDLVVWCVYINDASGERRGQDDGAPREHPWEARMVERLGLTSGRFAEGARRTPAQARMMAWRERSRLCDLVASKLNGWLTARLTTRGYLADWAEGSPGRAMVESSLPQAAVLARVHGFDLVTVMYPDLPSLAGDYDFAEQHAFVGELCAKAGIEFHDLTGVFVGRDPASLQAHAHDKHPNGLANRLAAKVLAEIVAPKLVR